MSTLTQPNNNVDVDTEPKESQNGTDVAPEGYAEPKDQGKKEKTCTRYAIAASVSDGYMRQIFNPQKQIDFDQNKVCILLF